MIGFVVAMNNEAEVLLEVLQNKSELKALGKRVITGSLYGEDVALIISGIGKVNAGISAQYLIDTYKPCCLVNYGLAGGFGEAEIGDIYFVDRAVQYDFDLSKINNVDIGRLEEFDDKYITLSPKVTSEKYPSKILATGDRFTEDKADEQLLTDFMRAGLRDMEGGAIAQTAAMNNTPLYMFKGVSDKVEKDCIKSYFEKSSFALAKLKERFKDVMEIIFNG